MDILKLINLEEELLLTTRHDDSSENPNKEIIDCNTWSTYTWTTDYHSVDENPYISIEDFLLDYFSEECVYKELWSGVDWNLERILAEFYREDMIVEPIVKRECGRVVFYRGAKSDWWHEIVGFSVLLEDKVKEVRQVEDITKNVVSREKEFLDRQLEVYTKWCNGESYYIEISDFQNNTILTIGNLYGCGTDEKEVVEIATSDDFDVGRVEDWKRYQGDNLTVAMN